MTLKIGIDLDQTLVELNITKSVIQDYHLSYFKYRNHDWRFTNFPKFITDEIEKRFHSPYWMCKRAKPFKGAYLKLREWKDKGNEIILITARDKEIREETKRFVRKNFPRIFNKIIFVNKGERKKNIFIKERIDIWIDDNPEDCKAAVDLGIKTYMISNEDTFYNHYLRKHKKLHIIEKITDL
jgi:uncharacterized HAD superfamily protein